MKTIIVFLFLTFTLFAQSSTGYLLNPKVKVGVAYSALSKYYFTYAHGESRTVYPGYSIGIALETAGLISYYNTELSLALETSYGQATTGEVDTYFGRPKFTATSLPILLWAKIKSCGKINPFVRIGIGTERTGLIEKYYSARAFDFNLSKWFFSWGLGAGIDLDFDSYNISLFSDMVIKESGIAEPLNYGASINYDGRNTFGFFGIQFGYKL
ncbi:MAG TPA: hypothetical protein VHO43_14840 [Ignavibacteriales bacterium]|nr:hypothetical protein [Ignavibacteriales bacterium]